MASYDRAASAPRQQAAGVHTRHGDNPCYEQYEVNGGPSHHPRHQNQHHHQSTISQVREPEFFAVANPGPLGLISFAGTTFVLGFYQCGVGLPGADPFGSVGPDQAVFGLAIFLGGAAQLAAGVMQFRVGNTFGTTLHCCYGAFWLSYAMFLVPSLGIRAAHAGDARAYAVALGVYLVMWCLLTLIFFFGALRTNLVILGVLGCLAVAFFLLAVAAFINTTHPIASVRTNRAGGAFVIICALLAFYAGSSGIYTSDTTYISLPLGEFGTGTGTVSQRPAKDDTSV